MTQKHSHFLSLKEIKEILELKPKDFDTTKRTVGPSPYKVAKQFGISHTTVYNIWSGKYKSIQKEKDSKRVSFFKKLLNLFIDEDIDKAIKSDSKALAKFQSFTDSLTKEDIKIMQEDLV